ncbi:hypothetical protein KKA33_01260 [Patescibacteria group bacterium]|nr:hypothetical protein [Patescibacteria group bacterium]
MFENLANILKDMGGKEKREKKEKGLEPELDKARAEREKLQMEVGLPIETARRRFRDAVRQDLVELRIVHPRDQAEYLDIAMRLFDEGINKKPTQHAEKVAGEVGLNKFLNEPGTYSEKLGKIIDSADPKKEAKKWAKKVEKDGKKHGFLSGLIGGWLFNWAAELQTENKGENTWLGKTLKKLAGFLGFKEEENKEGGKGGKKIDALAKKEAAKKPEAPAHEREIKDLKDLLVFAEIPVVFKKADYEEVLKTSPINGDPEILKKVVMKKAGKTGDIWMMNAQTKEENNLKDGKFKFRLNDFLVSTENLKAVYNALVYKSAERNIYQFPNPKNITPNDLRGLLDAVRTGEGLGPYKKPPVVASAQPPAEPAEGGES